MERFHSRHNVRGLGYLCIDGYCTEAYTSIVLLKEPGATQVCSSSETSPLESLEVIIKIINFPDKISMLSFRNFPHFSKHNHSPLKDEFENLFLPNQNTARD
jgi:hypothetical protein